MDGDLDVYVVSSGKNTLLVNQKGEYIPLNPKEIGLSANGVDAHWVDFNNDGLPDLHIIPQGLYQQNPNHKFKETSILEVDRSEFNGRVRSTWFDLDNDGSKDLLMAFAKDRNLKQWTSSLYRNTYEKNHWLQIKLIGIPYNNQAIGAKIRVTTPSGTQFQEVGTTDSSLYSQGHYRSYFGLGKKQIGQFCGYRVAKWKRVQTRKYCS